MPGVDMVATTQLEISGPWESPASLSCCVISRTELGLSELLFPHCRGCRTEEVGSQEASVGFRFGSPAHTSIYTLLEGCEEAEVRFEPWSSGFQVLHWVASTPQTHTLLLPVYLSTCQDLESLAPGWVTSLQRLVTPW